MLLSQKQLEAFLWTQPRACGARGLHIAQAFFATGRRYRRLRLGPYGVAQQASVRFDTQLHCYYVQVVVCTTGLITSAAYHQAQQQLAALRYLLTHATRTRGIQAGVYTSCVLIGQQVQPGGELADALAGEPTACQAYTYRYEVDGLRFEPVTIPGYLLPMERAALDWLGADLLTERVDALSIDQAARTDALASLTAPSPAELAELLITPAGVLAIPDTFR